MTAPSAQGAKRSASEAGQIESRRSAVFATAIAVGGPGLLVMLADTDAGNIVTAAEAGARWGYRLLPLPLLLIPVLAIVQELALRIGLFSGGGFGDLIRARLAWPWRWAAAAALLVATSGSLVTELGGIAGVGELYGASRAFVLPLAGLALLLVALTGEYRRVERIALIFGLFELSFIAVAWRAHPAGADIVREIADQKPADFNYLYLAAGLIGATFNPWMIFYQASALAEKRLSPMHYGAARRETIFGAGLTQALTAAVLLAVAALRKDGSGAPLESVGQISEALTPLVGQTMGRALFGAGVIGASMAAAIVSALACAWGLREIFGSKRSAGVSPRPRRFGYAGGYALCVAAGAALALWAPNLVLLLVAMQALNALLLPLVGALLVVLAATALPESVRLAGWRLWATAGTIGLVGLVGVAGALAGLF
jgi:Mn2+/Fe2+ NRAMP family transporter